MFSNSSVNIPSFKIPSCSRVASKFFMGAGHPVPANTCARRPQRPVATQPALAFQENVSKNGQVSVDELQKIFENNRKWAKEMMEKDPKIFENMASGQAPEFLWIGCSDSRLVVNQSTGLGAGEVFIHRNVGNIVSHRDLSCMSVIQFAVEGLGVKHIVVCGHYCCGAVQASLLGGAPGSVDLWIDDIRLVRNMNADELSQLPLDKRPDRLSELNVLQQVFQTCTTPVVQNAWKNGNEIHVHGLIYDIKTGSYKRLIQPVWDMQGYVKQASSQSDLDKRLAAMFNNYSSFNAAD
eukprot:TRINITY_DN50915_c0_g1_i1.p1 TRINITY_DN50915_c0_g1~~TRINITY_DN50915_c0_g1_i1.p1  ORF type:complete len:312 (-),score=34.81 TRINITY_DN50915_c0_g1_i1:550-1431(-)